MPLGFRPWNVEHNDEQKAQALLNIAKKFLAADKKITAMTWFQKVIDKFPETTAAAEAADLQSKTLQNTTWLEMYRKNWQSAAIAG